MVSSGGRRAGSVLASVLALVMYTSAAACSAGGAGSTGGSGAAGPAASALLRPDPALAGVHVTVGSRDYDEQLLLGQIAIATLKAVGADVTDGTDITGSLGARRALQTGRIDVYYDYTGAGWTRYLGQDPMSDPQLVWERTAKADLAQHGLVWLAPYAPFSNTYGLAVSRETSAALGVRSIADLARVSHEHPGALTLCTDADFVRQLPALEQAYRLDLGTDHTVQLDTAAVYRAVAQADRCSVGSVYTTDGRISSLHLVLLADDRRHFPAYNGDPVVREAFLRAHPGIAAALAPVTSTLDDATMSALNAKVSVDGDDPGDVARQFLHDRGFTR